METRKKARRPFTLTLVNILFCLIAPAAVFAAGDPVVYGMTPGRASSLIGAAMGLISIVSGGLALRSSARVLFKKRGAILALAGGLVCIVLSIVHLARVTGGFGTGSGKLGAIVAIVLGVTGTALGGIAMARYRRQLRQQ